MLTDLFELAARIQALREGPAGTLIEAFAQALVQDCRRGRAPPVNWPETASAVR
jgi:hypothetical protein